MIEKQVDLSPLAHNLDLSSGNINSIAESLDSFAAALYWLREDIEGIALSDSDKNKMALSAQELFHKIRNLDNLMFHLNKELQAANKELSSVSNQLFQGTK